MDGDCKAPEGSFSSQFSTWLDVYLSRVRMQVGGWDTFRTQHDVYRNKTIGENWLLFPVILSFSREPQTCSGALLSSKRMSIWFCVSPDNIGTGSWEISFYFLETLSVSLARKQSGDKIWFVFYFLLVFVFTTLGKNLSDLGVLILLIFFDPFSVFDLKCLVTE